MAADRPVVIVNPRSGGGLGDREWMRAAAAITDGLGPFDVRFTEERGHARRIAAEEAARRALIVAFGGDGTISEVADGMLAASADPDGRVAATDAGRPPAGGAARRPPAALGIIPHGTGGDFRRALDLPRDVAAAALRVRASAGRRIDAGRATFAAPDGSTAIRHFVNVASFGMSSDIAGRANHASKRLGARVAFLSATLKSLLGYDNIDVAMSLDGGEQRRMRLLLGAVGNGRCFGGGMRICPDAVLDDGVFDVVAVGALGRLAVIAKLPRLYAGTHVTLPEVEVARARTIEARPVDPGARIPVELDGETPGFLPARFDVLPGALHIKG